MKHSNKNKKRKRIATRKGSVLAYSLIILTMMLAIAAGISTITVLTKKSSSSTTFSGQAFQTADSGVQLAVRVINGGLGKALNDSSNFGSDCTTVGGTATVANKNITDAGQYTITFYKSNGDSIQCSEIASLVGQIKSVGVFHDAVRAVQVSVH